MANEETKVEETKTETEEVKVEETSETKDKKESKKEKNKYKEKIGGKHDRTFEEDQRSLGIGTTCGGDRLLAESDAAGSFYRA